MSYRIQIKIEVINEEGQVVNIKGHDAVTAARYSRSDFPLVTCDKGSTGFPNAESALTAANQLHAIIKPLMNVAG